jgi:beta-glucosidase
MRLFRINCRKARIAPRSCLALLVQQSVIITRFIGDLLRHISPVSQQENSISVAFVKSVVHVLWIACALILCIAPLQAQTNYPFQNPNLPLEERVSNIVSLMTLPEKVGFLQQRPRAVARLGIPTVGWVEGLHGVAAGRPGNWGRRSAVRTTTFPQSIGLGETWDPAVLRLAGGVEGYEARYLVQSPKYRTGGLVVRAPNADLARDPRWGRTEECYGEDPFLAGSMAIAYTEGLQGDDPRYWQAASLLKHFLANSNEDGRVHSSSDFDEQLFYDYYSMAFRMDFQEGGAKCFMAAYNAWNKIPCTVQPVINDVLIKQWNVDGIISTDAGSLPNLVRQHHYSPNLTEAAASAVKAGINQFLDPYEPSVNAALATNLLTEADIDRVLKGELRVYLRLGVLDPTNLVPYANIGAGGEPDPWTTDKNKSIARLATRESIVLLKNSKQLLPLDKSKIKSIAVVGPFAQEVIFDWYSSEAPYAITPLDGIKGKVGANVAVKCPPNGDAAAAVESARTSDVAIVCVGNNPNLNNTWQRINDAGEGRESVDRKCITLDAGETLIKQVLAANPRTVVVLFSSFPYAINWTQSNAPAILHMAHSSQEEGNALADVLFGDYNPAGRLVQTWPKSLNEVPPMMDYDIRHGRTYMYFKGQPLYPFGHGLSYTTFKYSRLKTSADTLKPGGAITVSFDVQNNGKLAGDEVVQLYVKHLGSATAEPREELRGFQRIALQRGERKTVQITLKDGDLAHWDTNQHAFALEPGKVQLLVGASSADIRLTGNIVLKD